MHRRVSSSALRAVFAVCLTALYVAAPARGQSDPPDQITGQIDATQRVVTNGVHSLAVRQNDQGRVNPAQVFHRMVLLLQGSQRAGAAAAAI